MRIRATYLTHWWQHARGLMFTRSPRTLVFAFRRDRRVTLHMMFVPYPIDALFLDAGQRIREKARLRPWRAYTSRTKARFIVEMPAGSASRARIGEKVTFI